MKKFLAVLLFLFAASCASVIQTDLMEKGTRNPDLTVLVRNPDAYRNNIFILGGIVAHTTLTPKGSEIEALYVPVNSLGYPEEASGSATRYIAVYPKEKGVLDPLIYRRDSDITIAGTYVGTTKGTVGEMEYVFPVFRIVQIYLGREAWYAEGYPYPYHPYGYYGPGWWGTYPLD